MVPFILFLAARGIAGVAIPVGVASQVLISAAGSSQGANGTFYRSDVTITNAGSRDETVTLQWLPAPGGSPLTKTVVIPAFMQLRSTDFVAEILGRSGLGSIIVAGSPTAHLLVSSRIWTTVPGTTGTTSETMPVLPLGAIGQTAATLVPTGGGDSRSYRINVGIVNLDAQNPQTFSLTLTGAPPAQDPYASLTLTIPPLSMQQVPVGRDGLPGRVFIDNATPAATRSNSWTAYSSTVDQVTGGAWSEVAVSIPPETEIHLTGVVKSIVITSPPPGGSPHVFWTIGPAGMPGSDVDVEVTADTKLVGNPQVGDLVNVVAQQTTDGLVATSITKE